MCKVGNGKTVSNLLLKKTVNGFTKNFNKRKKNKHKPKKKNQVHFKL